MFWNQLDVSWEVSKRTLNALSLFCVFITRVLSPMPSLSHSSYYPWSSQVIKSLLKNYIWQSKPQSERENQWKVDTFLGCLCICWAAVFWILCHNDSCIKLRVSFSFVLFPKYPSSWYLFEDSVTVLFSAIELSACAGLEVDFVVCGQDTGLEYFLNTSLYSP